MVDSIDAARPLSRISSPNSTLRVLSVVGEVRARQQHDLVVDDDELRVADDGRTVGELGGPVNRGPRQLGFNRRGIALLGVNVDDDLRPAARTRRAAPSTCSSSVRSCTSHT